MQPNNLHTSLGGLSNINNINYISQGQGQAQGQQPNNNSQNNFNLNIPNFDFEMNDDIANAALGQFIDLSKFGQDSKDKNSKK